MEDVLERTDTLVQAHLAKLVEEIEFNGGFSCPQQLDDVKDCLKAVCSIRSLQAKSVTK